MPLVNQEADAAGALPATRLATSEASARLPGSAREPVELVRRLAELAPHLRFHACFDLDPAGIRIARLLEQKAGVALEPTGMTPDLLATAPRKLELCEWDYLQLARGPDWAGFLEPLRAALAGEQIKVEQETIQRRLYDRLLAATTAQRHERRTRRARPSLEK